MARIWTQKSKMKAAEWLEIPKDALLDIPRVTLTGGLEIFIENHKGILSFDNQVLRLALTTGELVISGQQLIVRSIFQTEITVTGEIHQVQYLHA